MDGAYHVRQVYPCIWIWCRRIGAGFIGKRSILIQKAAEGAASWAAIEPGEYSSSYARSFPLVQKTNHIVSSSEAAGFADGKNLGNLFSTISGNQLCAATLNLPEEELPSLVWRSRDRKKTSI